VKAPCEHPLGKRRVVSFGDGAARLSEATCLACGKVWVWRSQRAKEINWPLLAPGVVEECPP
jgi:hypothetical protein